MPRISRVKAITGSDLTVKQKKFVQNFVANSGNATQAYISAGYKAKTNDIARSEASKLITKPIVREEISELLNNAGLSKQNVLDMLLQATKAGIAKEARNSDSLRGLNMVLKLYDMFPASKKQITKLDVTLDLNGKNWEELRDTYKEKLEEAGKFLNPETVEVHIE